MLDNGVDCIGGRTRGPACLGQVNPRRVSNKVLGWHFLLSVLANSRRARELVFGYDLLLGGGRNGRDSERASCRGEAGVTGGS